MISPDLFRKSEPEPGARKAPKWRTDQRPDFKTDRKDRFDKAPVPRFEKRIQEPVTDQPVENKQPVISNEVLFDEIKAGF